MRARTDRHNNPAAFTTAVAAQAGLVEGTEYTVGDPFPNAPNLHTARLLGDSIALTIKVIDKLGYYTQLGTPRWTYIQMPDFVWKMLDYEQRVHVIAFHYQHEGGTEMKDLFV